MLNKSQMLGSKKPSQKQQQPQARPLCSTNTHDIKDIYFCKRCAAEYDTHKLLDRVFFCGKCYGLADHGKHMSDRYSVTADKFKNDYGEFIQSVKMTNGLRFCHYIQQANKPKVVDEDTINDTIAVMVKVKPPIYASSLRNKLSQVPLVFADLRWIVENHFWDKSKISAVSNQIEEYVKSQFTQTNIAPDPWQNFTIEFGALPNSPVNLAAELEGSNGRLAQLGREKLLSQFFLQVTACFSNEDIDKNLKECARIEGQLGSGLSFLTRLGKLKALELHNNGSQEMKKILKEVDIQKLKPREKELYFYYSAVAEWVCVPDASSNTQSALFMDSRNKKYYMLANPSSFTNFMSKAIQINKNPMYLAARALGYMILGKGDKAQADFEAAKQLKYSNDSMDNNRLLNTINRNLEPDQAIFTQDLHERKTEYIMGLCKVFEKKRKYRELRNCCEELTYRQPRNLAFRVSLLRSLLKLKDTDAARHQLSEIKDLRELPANQVQEFQRRIQLLKAYEQEELGNYSDAEGKFEHAAKAGEPSASYWFNYAVFLFKHRNQRENNEKALLAINNALQIRVKNEYLELKYMLLFMMGNVEEAAKIQPLMKHQKFNSMKQYIQGNL